MRHMKCSYVSENTYKASAPKPRKIPLAQKKKVKSAVMNRPKNQLSQTIGPAEEEQRRSSGHLIHWEELGRPMVQRKAESELLNDVVWRLNADEEEI
jgi:hypothetical protein